MKIITRQEAISAGLTRYFTGTPCQRGHYADRLVVNTRCCDCERLMRRTGRKDRVERSRLDREARARAKDAGFQFYSTHKPCKHGHISDRLVSSGDCVVCTRTRSLDRYYANPEPFKKRANERYQKLPDRVKMDAARWAKTNRHKVLETSRRWAKDNPDKRLAHEHRRRSRFLQSEGEWSPADIQTLLTSQQGQCSNPYCRRGIMDCYTVDHIIPLTRGGTNWPRNLQLLCAPCNSSKNTKTMDEWVEIISKSASAAPSCATPLLVD